MSPMDRPVNCQVSRAPAVREASAVRFRYAAPVHCVQPAVRVDAVCGSRVTCRSVDRLAALPSRSAARTVQVRAAPAGNGTVRLEVALMALAFLLLLLSLSPLGILALRYSLGGR